jgi:hypothetical protein
MSYAARYILQKKAKENHINLLLIEKGSNSHFVYIKTMSRLVRSQIKSSRKKLHFCNTCLTVFPPKKGLEYHHELGCGKLNIQVPFEKPFIEFTNYSPRAPHPFVIYADLESLLREYSTAEPDPSKSSNIPIQEHVEAAAAYSIAAIIDDKNISDLRIFSGAGCLADFFSSLVKDVKYIHKKYLNVVKPMNPISKSLQKNIDEQNCCQICFQPFKVGDEIVRDHCHITGDFRRKSHNKCNINCKMPKFIPIFFHAGSSYDFKLLIMALSHLNLGIIKVLPKTKETYISFSLTLYFGKFNGVEIRFLDSYRVLSASLSNLTESLPSCKKYKEFNQKLFPNLKFWEDPQKQYFCYDYFNSFDKFEEESLPPIEKFFNRLKNEPLTAEQYNHATNVFNHLEDKTLKGYLLYYLSCDVYLLQDCFEAFREVIMKNFYLDPAFFYTLAGLSFDALLFSSKHKINLMTDVNMITLIKKNIRGGITTANVRYSKSNNKYLKQGFDETKEPIYSAFFDCNSLYGHTMMNCRFPDGEYQWVENEELEDLKKNLMQIPPDSDYGYILVVDLKYPQNLHDFHNCFPFCCERIKINHTEKLVMNLNDKSNYCIHYLNLQQAIFYGLELTRVHKAIKFHQSDWLKGYINLCATLRQNPNNTEFEKLLFKLMANVIFGKMIQSTDKYKNVKLVTAWKKGGKSMDASRLVRNPNFKSFTIFHENFVAIEMQQRKVLYDRPTIVGFTILELSKFHMYGFIYGVLKRYLPIETTKVAYCDTDSILAVSGGDIYQLMKDYPHLFDTSDYEPGNVFGIVPQNRKIPGLMHDEGKGCTVIEHIALRSKSYSIVFQTNDGVRVVKKLKSVAKSAVNLLNFSDYYNVWKNRSIMYAEMFSIYSTNNILETHKIIKKSLSGSDDKRHICPDDINTLALGHYKIQN